MPLLVLLARLSVPAVNSVAAREAFAAWAAEDQVRTNPGVLIRTVVDGLFENPLAGATHAFAVPQLDLFSFHVHVRLRSSGTQTHPQAPLTARIHSLIFLSCGPLPLLFSLANTTPTTLPAQPLSFLFYSFLRACACVYSSLFVSPSLFFSFFESRVRETSDEQPTRGGNGYRRKRAHGKQALDRRAFLQTLAPEDQAGGSRGKERMNRVPSWKRRGRQKGSTARSLSTKFFASALLDWSPCRPRLPGFDSVPPALRCAVLCSAALRKKNTAQ